MNKSIKSRLGVDNPIRHFYLHIPFCRQKCGYCSFHSVTFSDDLMQKYLVALQKEIQAQSAKYNFQPRTIYFGGGTPSLLSAQEIVSILDNFDLSQTEEITLEVNPITITLEYAKELKQTPINRISMGVQSWIDAELQTLGRIHDSKVAIKAFTNLREAGFENISLDLIYGLPNQKISDLRYSIQQMIHLQPEHISTYCLSLEKDVPLFKQIGDIPNDEVVAGFYFEIRKSLLETGYEHYEISNFAKPGLYSRHNSVYWKDTNYLGLGAAAAGYMGDFRYQNNSLSEYLGDIEASRFFLNQEENTLVDKEQEYIFLHLRTSAGIGLNEFETKFGVAFPIKYQQIIHKYQEFFQISEMRIALQPDAYFISNSILSEFM